jgi:F-type H+-transporting ATPase subunit b
MDLNATLLGQMITFAIFVWFTMRYVWPPIVKTMEERKQHIADGLAAGERGKHELELAHHKAVETMRDAKIQAATIIEEAHKRASNIVEVAKDEARVEGERLLSLSKNEAAKEFQKAREELKNQIATIAMIGAEKILGRSIDAEANSELLDKLITEI